MSDTGFIVPYWKFDHVARLKFTVKTLLGVGWKLFRTDLLAAVDAELLRQLLTTSIGISTQSREGGITQADPLLIAPEHRDAHPLTKLEPAIVRKVLTTMMMREVDGTLEWSVACLGYLVGSVRVPLRAPLLRGEVHPGGGIMLFVRRERLEPELSGPLVQNRAAFSRRAYNADMIACHLEPKPSRREAVRRLLAVVLGLEKQPERVSMKRDMGLIRELLLKLEELDMPPLGTAYIDPWGDELAIEGRTGEEILEHLQQLVEESLVEVQGSGFAAGGTFMFRRLTSRGHNFLDSIRDPKQFRKALTVASKAGGATVEFVWDITKAMVKAEIKKRTGFDVGD